MRFINDCARDRYIVYLPPFVLGGAYICGISLFSRTVRDLSGIHFANRSRMDLDRV